MTHWLDSISTHALADEPKTIATLMERVRPLEEHDATIRTRAHALIANQRAAGSANSIEAFLQSYGLTTREGIAMMCLAEALLRIPDATTADDLIEDTFSNGNWKQHLGQSDSTLVNASTWALMLTGSVLELDKGESVASWFGSLIKRSGEPVIRQALRAGMKFLGGQFVMGETVADAIKNARTHESKGYMMSYDILGEGARTDAQAQGYVESYLAGIKQIAASSSAADLFARPGISIKLSALHPRYTLTQSDRVMAELLPRLKQIIRLGMECNIAVSLDAEEANRLELELEIYKHLLEDPEFAGFEGIGFVLQAYQKRAVYVAEALCALAQQLGRRIPVRLVKGAYWDSEIKHAQMLGLPGYPVFTRKEYTDLSYLACAQILLAHAPQHIYPQFATHNALTVATILELAQQRNLSPHDFEFQRLHGMGESLHDQLIAGGLTPPAAPAASRLAMEGYAPPAQASRSADGLRAEGAYTVRVYAPVGAHKDLLAYLIRRLLENGANSSFVHLLMDKETAIDDLTISPLTHTRAAGGTPNPATPLPRDIYGPSRPNPLGLDMGYHALRTPFLAGVAQHYTLPATPADVATGDIPALVARAQRAFTGWDKTAVASRAAALRRTADLIEEQREQLIALCIAEAHKTYADSIAEIREAADFCRYYANEAERIFAAQHMPGPTGESNALTLHGRGVFLCISPWNFPLAIFIGQVVAALVSGNSVIAKPAEQTPRIAAAAVALLHKAGIPADALILACGAGETVGATLVAAPEIAGVCFTGSTAVAKLINRTLAGKDGPIVPLIAETGGMNAMIVDSSALLEQACDDIITSAFGSAGQRCSSLRMLFVQEEVAQHLKDLLVGAMDELRVGNPIELTTDIGPVIDRAAQQTLLAHIGAMKRVARWAHAVGGDANSNNSLDRLRVASHGEPLAAGGLGAMPPSELHFIPPHLFGLDAPSQLTEEIFGPVLHFFTYRAKDLPKLLQQIPATGYGLTFGLHTRLKSKMDEILEAIPAGNRYVNRSMTGAVVGVQPFGGEGLSGTGPKAGGPHYLLRFVTERTTTINTAAIGGNVELLA
jgi:RHH-type proline utilization regulon transcriptional repressor/proline dehydrogenase/delta 1-pyrroline-5-carboxylate dehydrogenase